MSFLPINQADLKARGWDKCDIILVTGDAYVDHPSYGAAMIGRVLEDAAECAGAPRAHGWDTHGEIL